MQPRSLRVVGSFGDCFYSYCHHYCFLRDYCCFWDADVNEKIDGSDFAMNACLRFVQTILCVLLGLQEHLVGDLGPFAVHVPAFALCV